MAEPGRGYGKVPREEIEKNLPTELQRRIHRDQALRELARQPPVPGAIVTPLPDDWEKTKPSEVVDDLKRAAQRHGVPTQMLARLLYQEGKFNERPLVMQSTNPKRPVGWVQMTGETLQKLKNLARGRGDVARAKELEGYSLANREQAFDAAAEFLAYQRRVLGSWPAAVAAYNAGDGYMKDWLDGKPASVNRPDPKVLNDKRKKWDELSNYLANAFRGKPEEFVTPDMYEPGNRGTGIRTAPRISRSPNEPDPWRLPSDTRENP